MRKMQLLLQFRLIIHYQLVGLEVHFVLKDEVLFLPNEAYHTRATQDIEVKSEYHTMDIILKAESYKTLNFS